MLRTLLHTDNVNFVPALLLLGSGVVPAAVLTFAAAGGARPAVSSTTVVVVAALGGVVGTVAAGSLEYDTLRRLDTVPVILVGLIEETAKLLVPAALLFTGVRSNRSAGVIVGVASGMGFATLETMGYGFTALVRTGSLTDVDQTLLLRALLSPAGHVAWTGMTCAALWAVVQPEGRLRSTFVLLATFVAAVALHAAWDGSDRLAVHVLVATFSVGALFVLLSRTHRRSSSTPGSAASLPFAEAR
ncbi:MAG: PrsW family intramembrane metalloprotease [Janthinobacterium lividum]